MVTVGLCHKDKEAWIKMVDDVDYVYDKTCDHELIGGQLKGVPTAAVVAIPLPATPQTTEGSMVCSTCQRSYVC